VVLLSGDAPTMSDHLRAIEDASRLPGVRRVASEIKSPNTLADQEIYNEQSPKTTDAKNAAENTGSRIGDAWITSAVKTRLLADERTPALDVNVDTTDGHVTLFGMVATQEAKKAAEDDAHKVSGVKTVANELEIVPSAKADAVKRDDKQVKDGVERALKAQNELKNDSIDVEVRNGVARLSGSVDDANDRLRAAAIARSAAGVRAVHDDLQVAGQPRR